MEMSTFGGNSSNINGHMSIKKNVGDLMKFLFLPARMTHSSEDDTFGDKSELAVDNSLQYHGTKYTAITTDQNYLNLNKTPLLMVRST